MRMIAKHKIKPCGSGKSRCLLLILALALFLLPLQAIALEIFLPELGLSLSLPNSLDAFTRSMSPDDPLLKLRGQSAGQVRDELTARGLSLEALDIAGAYTIQLSVVPDRGPDYAELDDSQLGETAGARGMGQYEILRSPQAAFVILRNGSQASCLTRVGSQLFTLQLFAASGFSEGMLKTLRGIARSMDFGLQQ